MASATLESNEEGTSGGGGASGVREKAVIDSFSYDDSITRMFATATLVWALVGTLAGLLVAILLVLPKLFYPLGWVGEYLTFGRLRPLHTNAAIFAFAGNAIFAAVYYSTQRLCKARMWSDTLSRLHALSKADNVGLGLIALGLMPQATSLFAASKLVVVWLLAQLSAATASQLIARAAARGERDS